MDCWRGGLGLRGGAVGVVGVIRPYTLATLRDMGAITEAQYQKLSNLNFYACHMRDNRSAVSKTFKNGH